LVKSNLVIGPIAAPVRRRQRRLWLLRPVLLGWWSAQWLGRRLVVAAGAGVRRLASPWVAWGVRVWLGSRFRAAAAGERRARAGAASTLVGAGDGVERSP